MSYTPRHALTPRYVTCMRAAGVSIAAMAALTAAPAMAAEVDASQPATESTSTAATGGDTLAPTVPSTDPATGQPATGTDTTVPSVPSVPGVDQPGLIPSVPSQPNQPTAPNQTGTNQPTDSNANTGNAVAANEPTKVMRTTSKNIPLPKNVTGDKYEITSVTKQVMGGEEEYTDYTPWITLNKETRELTVSPDVENPAEIGIYTVTVTATTETTNDEGETVTETTSGDVRFAVLSMAQVYTPDPISINIGGDSNQTQTRKVTVNGGNPLPEGTKVTSDNHPVVSVTEDDVITFTPNPSTANGNQSDARITVQYADGTTNVLKVSYTDTASTAVETYELVTEKVTVNIGKSATIGIPRDKNGKPLPDGTTLTAVVANDSWPKWATLNEGGTITVAPNLDVNPGTYTFETRATFPDGTKSAITNTVTVGNKFFTEETDQSKRPDGRGAAVGKALDNVLGTAKDGTKPQDTDVEDQDTEDDAETDETEPETTDEQATGAQATNQPATADARGAAALQTTGLDDASLAAAELLATSFALAAAALFATSRRREQD